MYIIDKLMLLNQNDQIGIDHELATYFLYHIDKVQHQLLNDIIKETAISKASIHRFLKKAGFISYREFANELNQEYAFISTYAHDLKGMNRDDYFDLLNDKQNFRFLAHKIANAKRLIIFGNIEQIRLFQNLSYYCLQHHIEIISLLSWEKEKNMEVLRSMNEQDVFLLIDVDYTLDTLWENVMDRSYLVDLDIINEKKCFKCFIGQIKQQDHHSFMQLHVPFHQNLNLKKCGILYIENQLINALDREKK